jgi:YVTN family beta-propeller protein
VIDTATNTVTATIPVASQPRGVAVSPNGEYAYVTNYGNNTVSVIDTATNTVTATIPTESRPYDVAITPNGAYAYVTNYGNNTVSVIDTATNTVTATIPAGSQPSGVAVSPNGAYAYVINYGAPPSVSVININFPKVNISPVSLTINVGDAQTFTAIPSDGSGTYTSYQWYVNEIIQSGQTAPTFSYSSSSTGSILITATVTDSLNVTSPQSNTASVTVNPAPTPTPTATPTPSPTPTATPTPTPNSTSTTEPTTPLVRNSNLSASILNIPSNPISPQFLVTTSTAAGAIGIVSLASIVFTLLSRISPSQIESLPLPKPLKSVFKKYAEKKIESIFKKKNYMTENATLLQNVNY